jgi:hypothetical protein
MRDPYLKLINGFNKAGIRYVVVGVSGINYYVRDASRLIITGDYDMFIYPEVKNVLSAVRELKKQGFILSMSGRAMPLRAVKKVVSLRKTIHAANHYGCVVELLLDISGYTFEDIESDARFFRASGVRVKVGNLDKLLNSKRIADRPKDRLFLKRRLLDDVFPEGT